MGEVSVEYILFLSSPTWSRWQTATHPAVNAIPKANSQGRGTSAAYVDTYILKLGTHILPYYVTEVI